MRRWLALVLLFVLWGCGEAKPPEPRVPQPATDDPVTARVAPRGAPEIASNTGQPGGDTAEPVTPAQPAPPPPQAAPPTQVAPQASSPPPPPAPPAPAPAAPKPGTVARAPVPPPLPAPNKTTPAPAPPRGGSVLEAEPKKPKPAEERPGLATAWGEDVASSTRRDPTFVRDDKPFALASLSYNDKAGIDAMTARLPQAAQAAVTRTRELPVNGGVLTVQIQDELGNARELVKVDSKTFVVGVAGERYTLAVTNHTRFCIVAVSSVDGLDVISGDPASPSKIGYVVEPFQTLRIQGWRRSADAVAAFRFSSVSQSYAAGSGQSTRNVGVIGFAFVSQKGEKPVLPANDDDLRLRDTANPFPGDNLRAR